MRTGYCCVEDVHRSITGELIGRGVVSDSDIDEEVSRQGRRNPLLRFVEDRRWEGKNGREAYFAAVLDGRWEGEKGGRWASNASGCL